MVAETSGIGQQALSSHCLLYLFVNVSALSRLALCVRLYSAFAPGMQLRASGCKAVSMLLVRRRICIQTCC